MMLNTSAEATSVRLGILKAWAADEPSWRIQMRFVRSDLVGEETQSLYAPSALEFAERIVERGGRILGVARVKRDEYGQDVRPTRLQLRDRVVWWLGDDDPNYTDCLTNDLLEVLAPPF